MPDHALVEPLLAEAQEATEAVLARWADRMRLEEPAPLGEALAYAVGTRGKRVRPALVIGSYRAAGGTDPGIVGIGAAVEVVHTYSLVHDPLAGDRGRSAVATPQAVPWSS